LSLQAEYSSVTPAAPAIRRSSCGGLHVRLAGARITLRVSGAAWLIDSRTLVVADLHLEKGSAFAVRGQMLPPYDSRDTLQRLASEIERTSPDTVVLLGDTFHDRKAEARMAEDDLARVRAIAEDRRLVWVVGNHDADGPRELPGEVVADAGIDGLKLVHEPSGPPARGEIAGHLHPAAKVVSYARGVRSRCFITDGERMILPAFGAYAGGLNVRDRAFDGLFTRRPMACALGRGRVHALKWDTLAAD
jgi:DNA ligase-associated metallophosphoesterase